MPFYGVRRMLAYLLSLNHQVGKDHVRALLRAMGLMAIGPRPNTSAPHPGHKTYPYLLRGVRIVRPNQVWSTDITYLRLAQGFAYLVAIIDWYSRYVLSWQISNSLETMFCLESLKEALRSYGVPEIFNSDQGTQFTSAEFTDELSSRGIRISMDGRGRCHDNIFVERLWRTVKYEDVYLRGYQTIPEAHAGLSVYFPLYNKERFHQALKYRTPGAVYYRHVQ